MNIEHEEIVELDVSDEALEVASGYAADTCGVRSAVAWMTYC